MRKKLRNRLTLSIVGAFVFLLGIYLIFGQNGLLHVQKLKRERDALQSHVSKLQAENARLEAEIIRLQTDDVYLEKVVREKLRLARPDETIIHFQDGKGNDQGQVP